MTREPFAPGRCLRHPASCLRTARSRRFPSALLLRPRPLNGPRKSALCYALRPGINKPVSPGLSSSLKKTQPKADFLERLNCSKEKKSWQVFKGKKRLTTFFQTSIIRMLSGGYSRPYYLECCSSLSHPGKLQSGR